MKRRGAKFPVVVLDIVVFGLLNSGAYESKQHLSLKRQPLL